MKTVKYVSTSAIAKSQGISVKALFDKLLEQGFVENEGGSWRLTDKGKSHGGEYRKSQYGKYIAWPEESVAESSTPYGNTPPDKVLSATDIGKNLGLSANSVNLILSELGWIHKTDKGWVVTHQGETNGGIQMDDKRHSGSLYVVWQPTIMQSKIFLDAIQTIKGVETAVPAAAENKKKESNFREKFEAKHRATDGHFVRSKAEMLIDNWLYMAGIVHAYERKLPIEEDMYCDFYIPSGKVYIEYWGYENDQKYLARKKEKLEIYKKYEFNLIELQDKEVQNLDDCLPRLLIKYGIKID